MIRDKIYLFGFIFLIVGLSFSRAFVSLSYVVLILNWLADPKVFNKFGIFFKSKPVLILASIYFMHLIGLVYTSDFEYAWLEIRTKIPLLILPLIFGTMSPLPKREFKALLLVFALSVVASFSTAIYWLIVHSPVDFRENFRFVSHIRLSLMGVFSIAIFGWLIFSNDSFSSKWLKLVFALLSIYLVFAIIVLEVMSGLLLLFLSVLVVSAYYIFQKKNRYTSILKYIIPTMLLGVVFLLFSIIHNYSTDSHIDRKELTINGNPYLQLENDFPIENGSPIGRNICWSEIENEWNIVSKIHIDSSDDQGNILRYTLLRYLNSMHFSKDSLGVSSLSHQDIRNIEMGFANIEYTKKTSIKKRIYKLLWEYDIYKVGGDLNESSALKRFYLWDAGIHILMENFWIGVGTGDVKSEFKKYLESEKSPLYDAGLRAHNQFISIGVAFGVIGLLWFLFAFYFPVYQMVKPHFLLVFFIVLYSLSMLWEDSLETQIGVTIFAFFYPLFLFGNPFQSKKG